MENDHKHNLETDENNEMPSKEFQEKMRKMQIKWTRDIYNKKLAQMRKEGGIQLKLFYI